MKNTLFAALIAGFTIASLAAPASAATIKSNVQFGQATNFTEIGYKKQSNSRRHEVLSPRKIAHALHRQGYRDINDIQFDGRYYKARAFSRRGPVQLIVSAHSGEIISVQRLRERPRHHGNPGYTFGGNRGGWSWSYTIR